MTHMGDNKLHRNERWLGKATNFLPSKKHDNEQGKVDRGRKEVQFFNKKLKKIPLNVYS